MDNKSKKSEAQIRNEEEVRRIMAERGYSSTFPEKPSPRKFPFGAFILSFLGTIVLIGGGIYLKTHLFDNGKNSNLPSPENTTYTKITDEQSEFQNCLGKIDTSTIPLDDSDFWAKHISRYEQIIACYDEYPSVSDSSEKATLLSKLNKLRENSNSAEANSIEYQNRMAEIDAELAKNLADIEARSRKWDEELAERQKETQSQKTALEAENQRIKSEREAEERARQEAEERARQEKETRCMAYVGKTKEELTDNDSEVKNAKNAYDRASSTYNKAFDDYQSALNVSDQKLRNAKKSTMNEAKNTMDAARLDYINIRSSKLSHYSQILNSCK